MTYNQDIIDFVAARWTPHSANPERPAVREDIGRGIALPICVGVGPWRYSAMYLRKTGSSWMIEAGSAAFTDLHRIAAGIAADLVAAGY